MEKMNAAMFYGPMDVRFERIDIPKPKSGEVLVKVNTALTCGTDIKAYKRGHPAMIKQVPTTFGHEFSGDIVELGEGVSAFKPGMRVVCCNAVPCQHCFYCKNDQQNLCANLLVLNGAYAEYIIIPKRMVDLNLLEIPDHLSYQEAALAEPVGTVVHAIRLTAIKPGDTVIVLGTGPLGLMIIRLAFLQGARVIALGKGAERLEKARLFGAEETIDMTTFESIEEKCETARNLTKEGRGAEVVIEAVGQPSAWEETFRLVRKGGTITFFGGCKPGTTITVDTKQLHYSELTLNGVFHQTPNDFRRSLELLSSRLVDGRQFVKEEVPLPELLVAFERVKALEGIKFAIDPTRM